MDELPPSNEDLEAAFTPEQLKSNINEKLGKINEYETGLIVLRNSQTPNDPFIIGRIERLEGLVADYKQSIEYWRLLLAMAESNGSDS